MLTVAFYHFILYSSTLFLWIGEKVSNKLMGKFFVVFSFFVIFLPSALRYGVGTDFFSYIELYENSDRENHLDFGFKIINLFLNSLGAHPQWAIAFYAFIFLFVAYLGIPKSCKCLFLFVLFLTLWFPSLNIVRQAIAVSFSILAFKFLWNNKFIYFLLAIVIGSSIHSSILVLIPLAVMAYFLNEDFLRKKIIIFSMFLVIFIALFFPSVFFDVVRNSLLILKMDAYANYFVYYNHFVKSGGGNIMIILKIFFCFFAIFVLSKKSSEHYAYRYMIFLFFMYGFSLALSVHIVIFSRMSYIFISCLVCGIPLIVSKCKSNILINFFTYIFICALMASFFKDSLGIPTEYNDPMLNPYHSVFAQ